MRNINYGKLQREFYFKKVSFGHSKLHVIGCRPSLSAAGAELWGMLEIVK